jgi:hypothetical protein
VIAHSPRQVASPLPEDVRNAIESFVPEAREAAVRKLEVLLRGKHRGLALSAHQALLLLKQDDSRRVSLAAEKSLEGYSITVPEGPEPTTPQPARRAPEASDQQPATAVVPERRPRRPEFRERVQPTMGYRLITPAPSPSKPPHPAPSSEAGREETSLAHAEAGGSAGPDVPAAPLDNAALEKVKQDLAVYIGPMARIIVARAARSVTSLRQLYEAVAAEIPSTSDRQKFLASRPH